MTDLIHKYSLQHLHELTKKPTPIVEQESEKSHSDILKIKKEQAKKQKIPKYTIKSTDKATLEEYDLKSALYQSMHTNKRRTKEFESIKKPSTTKETPKDKAPTKGSKTGKSALAKEPVEEPNAENPEWFKQPLRPPTLDPEWNKRQVVLDQPEQLWSNQMVSDLQDPLTFNNLMATPIKLS
ncbi:hypothetical protein Tco_0870355, partial [Tanacetum coccineum]